MNTNEASLGRSAVQTYSSREKRAFDGVLFSMECTAQWLENACDPMQAAVEIRLAMAELKSCIANCEFVADAGSQSSPPNGAIGEREAFDADDAHAVWHEWLQMRGTDIDFKSQRAAIELVRYAMNRAALTAEKVAGPKLAVWYGAMPESNGKTNWTAILHKGDLAEGHTIDRSEYPDRVRYEADCVRYLIGELPERPWILDYDADKHSGYIAPRPAQTQAALTLTLDQLAAVRAAANLAESMGSVVISADLRSILTASQPASGADHD
jgi:hypothetical protein